MAGAAVESIGQKARQQFDRGVAGVKSGLNRKTMGEIMGIHQLRPMGRSVMDGAGFGYYNFAALHGGKDISKAQTAVTRHFGKQHAKDAAGKAWHWASGGGYKGWGRVGAAGARLAGAGIALNVADFLNPFGFGSIAD